MFDDYPTAATQLERSQAASEAAAKAAKSDNVRGVGDA
jgi:hypothetical protein